MVFEKLLCCKLASCLPAPFPPSLLSRVTSRLEAHKLLFMTHCQMVYSGFLPMVYGVEFWKIKGRKEPFSCLAHASGPASLRRGSWLLPKCTPNGISALMLICSLLPRVSHQHCFPQTHLGSGSFSFWCCLTNSFSSRPLPRPLRSVSPVKLPVLAAPWVALSPFGHWTQ